LQSVGAAYKQEEEKESRYRFPAAEAAQLKYVPGGDAKAALDLARSDGKKEKKKDAAATPLLDKSSLYLRIATELRQIDALHRAVESAALGTRPELDTPYAEPQTPRQRELAELWARLLHLNQVGIRDDFTALGGTSLMAAQIFAGIEQRYGVRLPMTTILEATTVERLAERTEGGALVSLKLLRPGKEDGPALFLVHDGDGETLLYMNLARRLPEDVAVYGIEPRGNSRCPILHTRIADMAAYYVEQMQRVRPRGPYYMGGMCAGGVIAFEMAVQLRAKGLPVGAVALLDSAAPRAERRVGLIAKRRGARFLDALKDGGNSSLFRRLTRPVVVVSTKVRNLVVYEVTSRSRKLSRKIRFRLFRRATDQGRAVPAYLEGLTVRTVYELAEAEYVPARKLDAPTVLVRATEGEGDDEPFTNRFSDSMLGWGIYAAELKAIDVPGGHASMLQEPKVASLAEHMRASLEPLVPAEAAP
jgi:thioesterase domain-containing protein/acyl carrier protein